MSFGSKLKELRLEARLTQEQLAVRLGTTKQSISRYENGQRDPSLGVARKYANALGVSLSEIAGGDYKSALLAEYAEQSADLSPEEVEKVIDYILYLKSKRGDQQ